MEQPNNSNTGYVDMDHQGALFRFGGKHYPDWRNLSVSEDDFDEYQKQRFLQMLEDIKSCVPQGLLFVVDHENNGHNPEPVQDYIDTLTEFLREDLGVNI